MGKRKSAASAKRIKTRHKKVSKTRKLTPQSVKPGIRDINKVISQQISKSSENKAQHGEPSHQPIEVQTINIQTLRKLTGGEVAEKKQKLGKLSIDDGLYLEKLLKKWGTNYGRMAQDIKLNRLQWTAHQIQKKHQTYKKMFPQQSQNIDESK